MKIEVRVTGDLGGVGPFGEYDLYEEAAGLCEHDIPDSGDEDFDDGCYDEYDLFEGYESMSNQELGRRGETAAVYYLKRKGFEIEERNYTCPFGEADIVAWDDDCLVFVEVKTRRSIRAGIPEEAITAEKRARYERIAMCYLADADMDLETEMRFDAIGICLVKGTRALLRHHRGCFSVGE